MPATFAHHHPVPHVRLRVQDFTWLFPTILLLAIVTGAVSGLVNGVPSADVIGADGLSSTFWAVP